MLDDNWHEILFWSNSVHARTCIWEQWSGTLEYICLIKHRLCRKKTANDYNICVTRRHGYVGKMFEKSGIHKEY